MLPALRSLCVFRELLTDPVISALLEFLESDGEGADSVDKYCKFVSELYRNGADLSKYVAEQVLCCDNPIVRLIGEGKPVPAAMQKSAKREIEILSALASLIPEALCEDIDYELPLPEWELSKTDIAGDFSAQCKNISKHGYGVYAKYRAFCFEENRIVPVRSPDPISLGDLIGYEREKKLIIDNTKALLSGLPAANILLTGDAGTGKSSTVKAVVNALWGEGLRILELKKEQLALLPSILSELNRNPLRFIIFIDDLSFARNDDNFSALKAVLEGSVSAKADNVVIYATGNRRHLVRELHSDREGDEIHRNDAMQEIASLSERFGLHITFSRPDKATYLEIVRRLCDVRGIGYDPEKLGAAAERFALSKSCRSARAARQFVDRLSSGAEEDII